MRRCQVGCLSDAEVGALEAQQAAIKRSETVGAAPVSKLLKALDQSIATAMAEPAAELEPADGDK